MNDNPRKERLIITGEQAYDVGYIFCFCFSVTKTREI